MPAIKWARNSFHTLAVVLLALGLVWVAGAIRAWLPVTPGNLVTTAFLLSSLILLWRWRKEPRKLSCLLLLTAATFVYRSMITPRNDRNWVAPSKNTVRAEIHGDLIILHNFRNFEYRSGTDFTERWEEKTLHLSRLKHLDFYMTYWGSPHVCHTMLTFDFGEDCRVCASIEARREEGESYSPLNGIYRRYELIYILGDERDVVRQRTNFRSGDSVYLYRIKATPAIIQALFLDYLKSANELQTRPAWYDSVTTNCSTLILAHARRVNPGEPPWDWRLLLNGHAHERLYAEGYITHDLPLDELKRRSLITPAALSAGNSPDFSDRIRAGLPGFP